MGHKLGSIARRGLPQAAVHEVHRRGWLDPKLGMALLRDRQVAILAKLAALATGVTLTAILVALEFPLESVIGLVLPFLGLALDVAFDGFEVVVMPLLIATLAIRWFAPKEIVEDHLRSAT